MKYLPRLLPTLLCFAWTACSESTTEAPAPAPMDPQDTGVTTSTVTDSGFTAVMDAGVEMDAETVDVGFPDTGPVDTGVIDPNEEPVRTLRNSGPGDTKIDIVIIGDGYRIDQLDNRYEDHVNRLAEQMFERRGGNRDVTQPFRFYADAFNVHRIHLASAEAGIDDPANSVSVDTALDGSLACADPVNGPCHVDFAKLDQAIEDALDGSGIVADWRVLVLNTTEELGAVVTTPNGPLAIYGGGLGSGNGDFQTREVAMSQLAIAFCGAATENTDGGAYTGGEPAAVNLSLDNPNNKWNRWVGFNPMGDGIAAVGYYEGGGGFSTGVFKPTPQSKLNNPSPSDTSLGYNAVVREAILLAIYDIIPLVTPDQPTDEILDNPQFIDVTPWSFSRIAADGNPGTADPLTFDWDIIREGQVLDVPVSTDTRLGFRAIAEFSNLPGGAYRVRLTVADESPWFLPGNGPTVTLEWNLIYRP